MNNKNNRQKAADLFTDPTRPMTYGWLEQVMSAKKEGNDKKQRTNRNPNQNSEANGNNRGPKKSKRSYR